MSWQTRRERGLRSGTARGYNRNNLNELIDESNASGYGLTLSVRARITNYCQVTGNAKVGNPAAVNHNMVLAVVGVQPFGLMKVSPAWPLTGQRSHLYRLLANRPENAAERDASGHRSRRWMRRVTKY